MPWLNVETGEHVYSPSDYEKQQVRLVYVPSIYAKEELPTWAEVYEEFYLNKQFSCDLDIKEDNIPDPYWKIPHKKVLIATVCNQFNKMVFEDNLESDIVKKLSKKLKKPVSSIQFVFTDNIVKTIKDYNKEYHDKKFDKAHEIYTIPIPNGKRNPFILDKSYKRIVINGDIKKMQMYAILQIKSTGGSYKYYNYIVSEEDSNFNFIIDNMISYFKNYFEGEIGWKDLDGNLIEGDISCRACTGAGYSTK